MPISIFSSNYGYRPLKANLQIDSFEEERKEVRRSGCIMSVKSWIVHTGFCLFSGMLFLLSILNTRHSGLIFQHSLDSASLPQDWSPELAALPMKNIRFNGSFEFPSEFRGATTEVDEAWNRFTKNKYIDGTAIVLAVSEEDIRNSNKVHNSDWYNSTVVLQETEDDVKYMATLEVFHQLHCLNMLRKATFGDHYEDDFSWKFGNGTLRKHLDHCLEIIRQVVMCRSDPGLIMFHWVKDVPTPYPDFNTWHQCRDIEADFQWAEEHAWQLQAAPRKSDIIVESPTPP